MLELLFNKVAGLETCNFIKKRLQHRCFLVNIAKFFKSTYTEEHLRMAASVLIILLGIYWPSLLNKKLNVGWFLLKMFVDLLRVYSLLIISRNHFKIQHIFIDWPAENKNLSKVKNIAARAICSDISILTGLDRLLSTTDVYFNDMQKKQGAEFFQNISGQLLLKFIKYLFLKSFVVSLDKFILLAHVLCWNFLKF